MGLEKIENELQQVLSDLKRAEDRNNKIIGDQKEKIASLKTQLNALYSQIADGTLAGAPVTNLQKSAHALQLEVEEAEGILGAIEAKLQTPDRSRLLDTLKNKIGKPYDAELQRLREQRLAEEKNLRDRAAELLKKADIVRSQYEGLRYKSGAKLLLPFAETIDPRIKNFASDDKEKAIAAWLAGRDMTREAWISKLFPEAQQRTCSNTTIIERPKEPTHIDRPAEGPGPGVGFEGQDNPPIVFRNKNGRDLGGKTSFDQ